MSLTTDRVRPSKMPNSWRIGRITSASAILGGFFLAFCTAILAVGKFELGLGIEALRTLSVVAIVYASQATIYAIQRPASALGTAPDDMARNVLYRRPSYNLDVGHSRDCNGASTRRRLWPVNLQRLSFSF